MDALNLNSLFYDAIYIFVFLCCVIVAANRGAFRAVAGIGGTIAGAVCGSLFNGLAARPIAGWLTPLAQRLFGGDSITSLSARIDRLDVPDELRALAEQAADAADGAADAMRERLADGFCAFVGESIAPLLAFLLIFVLVKLAVSLVCSLLSLDIPILSTLNEWVGALLGAVSGALMLVVLTWALWRFAPALELPLLTREALLDSRIGGFLCRLLFT